ncbi:MAG: M36 family metallopeptidase, partial [Thermoanaerobaculia bacterium]
ATTARGVGNYVIFQPSTGPGIRPAPYTTDMAVNSLTYGILAGAPGNGISIPHGVGTVWNTALWEMYWNLVDTYGFDADLYTGSGGNNLAMQLVVDGMKMQPCGPTFLNARDAILSADLANNAGANKCDIWDAFAKRGMGLSADDGGDSSSLAVTEAFDKPVECSNTAPVAAITAPADLSSFDVAVSIGFTGTADDAEDGDIKGNLDWTSDLDGMIGSGGSFSTTLSVGFHTVTASVTDSGGLSDSDEIQVIVDNAPGCVTDLVVDDPTVSGAQDFDGVNSVTLGPGTEFDATSVVTVEAGNFVAFADNVSILGTMAIVNTPTPCP